MLLLPRKKVTGKISSNLFSRNESSEHDAIYLSSNCWRTSTEIYFLMCQSHSLRKAKFIRTVIFFAVFVEWKIINLVSEYIYIYIYRERERERLIDR